MQQQTHSGNGLSHAQIFLNFGELFPSSINRKEYLDAKQKEAEQWGYEGMLSLPAEDVHELDQDASVGDDVPSMHQLLEMWDTKK